MNLFLHGIGGASVDAEPCIEVKDSLAAEPSEHYDMVLANPPFGKKSSVTLVGEDGKASSGDLAISRPDFWATTSNKQLNFVQHIRSMLQHRRQGAVVLPDNVLFEGGAGETIRRRLLHECDVHTLLRLPTGLFYAQGVKANVVFFERKPGATTDTPATSELWVYDFRTNQHFTLKTKQLSRADLDDFVEKYQPGGRHERVEAENFKRWTYDEIAARPGFNLDIWADVNDESLEDAATLPAPAVIAEEIVANLTTALEQFAVVATTPLRRARGAPPVGRPTGAPPPPRGPPQPAPSRFRSGPPARVGGPRSGRPVNPPRPQSGAAPERPATPGPRGRKPAGGARPMLLWPGVSLSGGTATHFTWRRREAAGAA